MIAPRRHSNSPQHRRNGAPLHPTGRARRRWPRAYDGGAPERLRDRVNPRYHRAYDQESDPAQQRRGGASVFQRVRQSPVRNGLIGLAVVGAAAPVAVHRYQEALRGDPAHERMLTQQAARAASEFAVQQAWQQMRAERENAIVANMQKHSGYGITRELAEQIYDSATEAAVDPELAFNLVRAESSFQNSSTSPVGAIGLTQLMPGTAADVEPGVSAKELRDSKTNLRIGFKYLRKMIDRYSGDTKLALLAYNRGPGTVDRAIQRGADPDNGYADFVDGKVNHGHTLFTE